MLRYGLSVFAVYVVYVCVYVGPMYYACMYVCMSVCLFGWLSVCLSIASHILKLNELIALTIMYRMLLFTRLIDV